MRILAVDDERLALDNLLAMLKRIIPEALVAGFTKPAHAFSHLSNQRVDIAFLDIEMGGMNGITLAKKCKDLCPDINIIFVTGYDKYTMDALRLHASGYLIKPIRAEELLAEMDNLRYPVPQRLVERVKVHTFGNFEVFVNRKPLYMPIAKCRECLAYIIDRKGARITVPELAAVLWEDEPYDKRVQNKTYRVISDMMAKLQNAGIADIILKNRKDIAINTERVDCDYYRFLNGETSQINAFLGEYMSNYGWAEFTLAGLTEAKQNLIDEI